MTNSYTITFKPSALKDMRRIPGSVLESIKKHIRALVADPFPPGAVSMSGYRHYYRIRIGNYRVIYQVFSTVRIVSILRVGHRKDIYKIF